MTASELFAGPERNPGPNVCYYCGAPCDDTYLTKTYVRDTFTNRDVVKYPSSDHVCRGCVLSMGDGWENMPMLDGSVKGFDPQTTNPRSLAPRLYSWLISVEKRLAFTKAHIGLIRGILTEPDKLPEPPFTVVLTDSGQKQLIFRAPVALKKDAFEVMLEDQAIEITPEKLSTRLRTANQISTKLGKPILSSHINMNTYIAARKWHLEPFLNEWQALRNEPLSRLAAWLAEPKEK